MIRTNYPESIGQRAIHFILRKRCLTKYPAAREQVHYDFDTSRRTDLTRESISAILRKRPPG